MKAREIGRAGTIKMMQESTSLKNFSSVYSGLYLWIGNEMWNVVALFKARKKMQISCYGSIVKSGLQLQEQLVKDHLPLYVTH